MEFPQSARYPPGMYETRYLRTGVRRWRREELRETLAEASAKIGCSVSSLSRWERGDAPVPAPYWEKIERALGLWPHEAWRGVREGGGR
jgi:ribosome-binding protein aMBF1 (putative translation factor)